MPPAYLDRGDDVVHVPRHDDADGNLAVVRCVGGVQRAASAIEADLAAYGALKIVWETVYVVCCHRCAVQTSAAHPATVIATTGNRSFIQVCRLLCTLRPANRP